MIAQDFSVQIWNLPKHKDWRILKAQLWNYIDNVMLEQKKLTKAARLEGQMETQGSDYESSKPPLGSILPSVEGVKNP